MSMTNNLQMNYLAEQVARQFASRPDLIARLLNHIGAAKVYQMGHEIRSTCPLHGGNNGEAFVVWTDRGVPIWKCYTDCHDAGGIVKLVIRKYRCPYEQAVMWLAQFAGLQIDPSGIQISRDILDEGDLYQFKRQMGLHGTREDKMNVFPETMIQTGLNVLHAHPSAQYALDYLTGSANETTFWGERKKQFPLWVLQYFQVGFVFGKTWIWNDPTDATGQHMVGWFEDRISIPWRNLNGECCGFSGRRVDGVPIRKYKVLPGTSRALALYGLHDRKCLEAIAATKTLHLVEGFGDQWRAYTHQCFNTVSGGGTEYTREQIGLMRQVGVQKVVIYNDGDDAGRTAAVRTAKQLYLTFNVEIARAPDKYDPGDLLIPEQFWSPIQRAVPYVPGMF